ncbi:pitrilysin family protein [Rufibacter sp. LB8]|uniref:M16 family metallopeptidase n=1 Tax=Rufibacter sp. LB8 TaxID=2777781 RepID=UPI00178C6023|nr:pitrilysin family protein [Rufibacter sp. LB8]
MIINRLVPPLINAPSVVEGIEPTLLQTGSGAKVHVYQNTVQPVVRVEFVFKAGKWYQPKAAVASLTAKMLKEGTATHTAKGIADFIDFYGASLEVTHGFDRSTVTLYCLSKYLPALLPLAFELILSPSFPEEEFELTKKRIAQSLTVDKQKNSYIATEHFTTTIYGKGHPYATFISEEEIEKVCLQDVKDFHKSSYSFSEAEVFICGDIGSGDLELILKKLEVDSFPFSAAPYSSPFKSESNPAYLKVSSSNQMQAAVRVGKVSISPQSEYYSALFFLNHVLGGYFGSRLMTNIREDKGFTYGIHSSISAKEHSTLFSIGTDIKGDKIEETLKEIEAELQQLIEASLTEEELETVKKHILGKFLNDQSTVFDKMDRYKQNILLGLPSDSLTILSRNIEEMSIDELSKVAANYLKPDSMYRIVVGGV